MKYLLDTCTVIWYFKNVTKLPPNVLSILETVPEECCVSVCSCWELMIKFGKEKNDIAYNPEELFDSIIAAGMSIEPIKFEIILRLANLPFHHKDPFDRLLIATAKFNNLTFLTGDPEIQKYNVDWVWN